MNRPNLDVITAFIDNELFEATTLGDALATTEGRALLLDLVALRDIVQPEDRVVPVRRSRMPSHFLWVAAAAGIVISAIAGFQVGATRDGSTQAPPPAPTVVVTVPAWTDISTGGQR